MSASLAESASALVPQPGATSFRPGDVATLVVRASWDGGGTLQFPTKDDLEGALQGKVHVLDDGGAAPADAAALHAPGAAQDARAWKVQLLLAPGEQVLPDVPVTITADGAEPVKAAVAGPSVTIDTVLDAQAAESIDRAKADPEALKQEVAQRLAPARGPWELAARVPWWAWLALALLACALLAWLVSRLTRRRKQKAAAPVPLEAPEIVARRRLRELRESAMLTTGRHLEFHVALADILKEYLERRLAADLRERTTEEIRRLFHGALKNARHVGEIRQDTLSVLNACDLVKFAKAAPMPSEALGHVETCERIVTKTTEAAPAPAVATAGKEAA